MWETPSAWPVRVKQGQSEGGLKYAGVHVGTASDEVLEAGTSTVIEVMLPAEEEGSVVGIASEISDDVEDGSSAVLEGTSDT